MKTILAFTLGVVAMVSLFLWVQKTPYGRETVILAPQGCEAATAFGLSSNALPSGQCKLVGRTRWSIKTVSIGNVDIDRAQVVASTSDKTGEAWDQLNVFYGLFGCAVLLGATFAAQSYRQYRKSEEMGNPNA